METYDLVMLVHVLAAVVWVGGASVVQVFAIRTVGRDDPHEVARFAGDAEWVGLRVFMPASILLVLAGGWMVVQRWSFETPWIAIGLGLYVLSFITGMGFLGPESGRISKLTDAHGVEHPEVQRRIRRVLLVSRVELVWLVAIVALMVLKPS